MLKKYFVIKYDQLVIGTDHSVEAYYSADKSGGWSYTTPTLFLTKLEASIILFTKIVDRSNWRVVVWNVVEEETGAGGEHPSVASLREQEYKPDAEKQMVMTAAPPVW